MADFEVETENEEAEEQKEIDRKLSLSNTYSEFKRVDNAYVHNDSTVGKAHHCINTIEELNERISNLSNTLEDFSNHEEGYFDDDNFDDEVDGDNNDIDVSEGKYISPLAIVPKNFQNSETERKEVKQFSGMYALQTILSKEDNTGKKQKQIQSNNVDRGSASKKPMLVELHSFPGYDKYELTPLPASLTSAFIMDVVINAQKYLQNKLSLKKTFHTFLNCQESITVFQDSFWWYFCHKYQPSCGSQEKLFDRIAKNYTKLLFAWSGQKHQEQLFKNYSSIIAQSIYATFCYAFPTSYRQFHAEFRDELLSLTTLWIMGIRPSPRSSQSWNFNALEPRGLLKGEMIYEDATRAKTFDCDFNGIVEQSPSSSCATRKFSKSFQITNDTASSTSYTTNDRTNLLDSRNNNNNNSRRNSKKVARKSMNNALHQISSALGVDEQSKKKQSSPVGKGASFSKVVFDVNGRSPLVEYFLSTNHLDRKSGTSVYVQRTEIKSLPPLTCQTYDEFIEETIKTADATREEFDRLTLAHVNERKKFSTKQIIDNNNFKIRAAKLLSDSKEVRKISELLKASDTKEGAEESDKRAARLRTLLVHTLEGDDEG